MEPDIEQLFNLNSDQLYAALGQALAEGQLGMAEQTEEELREEGRTWLERNRDDIAKRICGSRAVKVYLSSEKARNRILIAASIADMLTSLKWGAGGTVVAVMIVQEGLETLCSHKG
jgi:hypothetical protein